MKLTDHLYYYRFLNISPFPGMMTGNTCVIRGDDGALSIIDPGPSIGPRLDLVRLNMLADGLHFSDIESVIIYNAHPDHGQIAQALARKTGATLYAHELEREALEKPDAIWQTELDALGGFRHPVLPVGVKALEIVCRAYFGSAEPVTDWTPVKDGESLYLGTTLRVIGLGGHRPGEIAIYIEDDAAIVTGDLMHKKRFNIPSLNFPLSDLSLAMESLKRIEKLDIEVMVNGHETHTKGRKKIRKWIHDCVGQCERMREICDRTILEKPGIGITELSLRIIEWNPFIPKTEMRAIAYATLKSTEKGREWIARNSD